MIRRGAVAEMQHTALHHHENVIEVRASFMGLRHTFATIGVHDADLPRASAAHAV